MGRGRNETTGLYIGSIGNWKCDNGCMGFVIHFFVFLNMFDVSSNKNQKKKIVMAAYGQKTQVQIAQSQLFKGLYGSQNYSNLFLVTLS